MSSNSAQDAQKSPILQIPRELVAIGRLGNFYVFPDMSPVEALNVYRSMPDYQPDYELISIPYRVWFKSREIYLISDSI
jgi:hypothetical protein